MANGLDIKVFKDKRVEITVNSKFTIDLDEHGLPKFPESLKEELPPYVPEMVELVIESYRHNLNQGPIDMVVCHKPGCPEARVSAILISWCNPDLVDTRKYSGISDGTLTCKRCNESSIGEILRYNVIEDDSGCWERFWIEGGDMFYWVVAMPGTELRSLFCHFCMIKLGIKFPNLIEDEDDSRNHQLH